MHQARVILSVQTISIIGILQNSVAQLWHTIILHPESLWQFHTQMMLTDVVHTHYKACVLHPFAPKPEVVPINILSLCFYKEGPIQNVTQSNTLKQEMTQRMSRQE